MAYLVDSDPGSQCSVLFSCPSPVKVGKVRGQLSLLHFSETNGYNIVRLLVVKRKIILNAGIWVTVGPVLLKLCVCVHARVCNASVCIFVYRYTCGGQS